MKKIYKDRRKWKEKMWVFLGLCSKCGNYAGSYYMCARHRKQKLKQRVCKVDGCNNIVPKSTQFCDKHASYRGNRNSSKVSFNFCKYCNQLFTAKKNNCAICKNCRSMNIQSKEWKSKNKERAKEIAKKCYHKRKDNVGFKKWQKEYRIKNKPKSDIYFKEYNIRNKDKRAIQTKEYHIKHPEVREKSAKTLRDDRFNLEDWYIKEALTRHHKANKEDITPIMIDMKRELLIYHRLIKELNNVINCKRD